MPIELPIEWPIGKRTLKLGHLSLKMMRGKVANGEWRWIDEAIPIIRGHPHPGDHRYPGQYWKSNSDPISICLICFCMAFLFVQRVWDTPGILPDPSGWILGQNIEVTTNRKCQQRLNK